MKNSKEVITEELILRSLEGHTTAEEEELIQLWRESAPENEREYSALVELWSLVDVAAPSESSVPPLEKIESMIARAEGTTAVSSQIAKPRSAFSRAPRGARRFTTGLLAACIAVVGVGLGLLSERFLLGDEAVAVQGVVTGDDERTTVTLSDGTAVRMGPNSTIRIIEGKGDPVVWLEGRAFFGVVPDPSRAFTVRTVYGDAMALGTRFEVRTDEDELRVLVVEGNVRVSTLANSLEIGEGLMSRSDKGGGQSTSHVEDVYEQLEWVGSTLVFRATPLARVLEEIERQFEVVVELEDDSLGERTVTATFTEQPVEEVLFVVCQIVGAGCAGEGDHFRMGDRSLGTLDAAISQIE